MEKVKVNNCSSILRLLNQRGPMSRKDIAVELGLTSAAVTILCNDMMSQNIIVNKGELVEEKRAGRKKILIDINSRNKMIVSISIEPIYTYLYLCDIKGNSLHNRKIKTDSRMEASRFLNVVADTLQNLLNSQKIQWSEILGVGVTVTGIVDRERGISKHAYGIWDYVVPMKLIFEDRFQTHVTVGNNVKAFAEAELIYGARRTNEHILLVKWGPGVGSAIAIRDNTYEGKDYMAGELGHYVVDIHGKRCRCGRKGCLETKVSYQTIVENISMHFNKEEMPQLYELVQGDFPLLEREIIEDNQLNYLLTVEEPVIDQIILSCIQVLALSIVNAMTILAPNQVILLSQIFDKEKYYRYFLECCKAIDNSISEQVIIKSKLEHAIHYIGGLAIAADHDFFSRGGFITKKEEAEICH